MDPARTDDSAEPDDSFLHSEIHENEAESALTRREYIHGIGLLLVVVFLWTSSNFITQVIHCNFATHGPLIFEMNANDNINNCKQPGPICRWL